MNHFVQPGPSTTTSPRVAAALELLPELRERAAKTDGLRMVPPETIADFHHAGFFRMFQSNVWDGLECHPAEIFEVQEILARGCPSSAWVMGVVGVHNWQLAHFSKRAQDEVWGSDPKVLVASSYAPTGKVEEVDGGCVLRGRWHYSSGVDHAEWVLLGGNVASLDGSSFPDYRTFLVPKRDYRIVDDWHVLGLKGTGSKSVELDGAFVPDHRQLPAIASQMFSTPGQADGTADGPLFRIAFPTIFGACITTPALGAAQAMLDIFVETSRTAASKYSGARWADEQSTQVRIAESDAELRAARVQMRSNFVEHHDAIVSGREFTLADRARYRFDHCNVVELAHRAADRLFVASGARSLSLREPMQRLFCDIQAARVHAINNRVKWGSTFGRIRLGDVPDDILGLFI